MRRMSLLLVLAVVLAAGVAQATIDSTPIRARVAAPQRLAAAGRELSTTLTIEAAAEAALRDLSLAGDGWSVTRWDGLRNLTLTGGGSVQFTLTAVPRAGYGPLVVSAEVNGRPWRQSFDLSPEAYGGILPSDSDLLPPRRFLPSLSGESKEWPRLTLAELTALATAKPAADLPADKNRTTCTVTGTIIYMNSVNDSVNVWLPATHASVWLYTTVGGIEIVLGSGTVDADGDFSIAIPDDQNFRVGYSASSNAVIVQESGIWEEDYVWVSNQYHTPAGATNYHTGQLSPGSHPGALHICYDITCAHDYFRDLGWDMAQIDCQWPSDGSNYQPFFEELHLEREDSWHDGTICHEWGHYFQDRNGHNPLPDYCNGVCDDDIPWDCGHCGWCPETDLVTWVEGVAQFLSRINTDHIEAIQDLFRPVHKGLESLQDDPGCDMELWNIENIFGGAVWDMVDTDYGLETNGIYTDVLGRQLYDRLNLETDDILNILCNHCDIEGHEPYRQPAFYRCAYEYLRELDDPDATPAKLWETLMSWGLDTDTQEPDQVTGITCSLPVGQPTSISLVHFDWTIPDDDASGVCGYSITLTPNQASMPDMYQDLTVNYYNSSQLSPGNWYFGIRAVDRTGRAGQQAIIGPIIITAPGTSDLAFETPSGWTAPLVARNTTVGGPPAPVGQPGLVNGQAVYFNWAGRNVGTGPSGTVHDAVYLDGALVHTGNAYYVAGGVGFEHRDRGPVNTGKYGRHAVWVELDSGHAAAEDDEEDNFYAKQFVFQPLEPVVDVIANLATALPDPEVGHEYVPAGTIWYPNCMGLRVTLCLIPDVIWAMPNDPDNRIVARLHAYDINQTGFAAPLAEATNTADTPAAVIQNPLTSARFNYCVGLVQGQPAGPVGADVGYRYCREQGTLFAMPDTVTTRFLGTDCLDHYYMYNDLGEDAWFTIKLVNHHSPELKLRIYDSEFELGTLADAAATVHVAQGDTSYYNVLLPQGHQTLAVVTRDARANIQAYYTIFAYSAKPDPAASTPDGWFANTVPQIGTPYYADSDDIPAPTALTGGSAATGIYWSLKNESPDAGIPIGLQHEVAVDGSYLFGGTFIEPLLPGHEVKAVHSSLFTVRGGRHTLSHRINSNGAIDEDNWTNNRHGRQWVWSSQTLAANTVSTLPVPSNPFGGLTLVTEGTVALNCDGYRPSTPISPTAKTIVAAYATSTVHDLDLGLFSSNSVQEGFTTDLAMSQWSGPGCDFVLRGVAVHGTATYNLGVIRAGGPSNGNFTLATKWSTDVWENPVQFYERGTVEAGTYLDALYLDLPPGSYRFTLRSRDVDLGVSLHDFSARVAAKTEPWENGIAWQTPDISDQDVSFLVSVPAVGTPTDFVIVVWRPDGTSVGLDGDWQVTVTEEATGIDDDDPSLPAITASRLVSAAPNPFNPMTEIAFELAQSGSCELTVHDVRGRLVRTLVAGERPAGRHEERWDGFDDAGQRVSSGIYMARLRTARGEADLLKLTLVK